MLVLQVIHIHIVKLFDSDNYTFGNTLETFTFLLPMLMAILLLLSVTLSIVKDDNTGPVISAFLPNLIL